ncbi:MAG: VWA domain-containing protein [Candidatus Thorarchaeota archaeon]|nr:MAG: VWA domain-containing protein [Candidatus Thorarchaeota archaeon]
MEVTAITKKLSLEIIDGGDLRGFVNVHPKTAKKLDVDIGSIVIFEDPQSSFWGAAEVRKNNDVSDDHIVIDTLVLEASLLMEGDQVEVTLYDEDMLALEYVEFGIKPLTEDANTEDLVSRAAERVKSLENIIGGRLVYPGMAFNWPELAVKVEIINTKPDLAGKRFAKLAFEALRERTGYQFKTVGIASPFNAVLCVDTSGSMKTTDVPVQDIAHAREGLKDLAGDSPEVHAFLNRFEEGRNVSRAEAAAMAVLLYLAEKVGRGYGEKVGVITFEKEVSEMTFLNSDTGEVQPFVECTGREKALGLQIISTHVVDKVEEGGTLTDMGSALAKAHEIMEEFGDPNKPTMLIMLTDGMTTSGPPPLKVLKERFTDRNKLVIYSIGLGERSEIDEELMLAIAQYGNGSYRHVDNMRDLLEWYGKLAGEFAVVIRGAE